MDKNFELGDIVEMKKGHPCGTNEWEIIRTGADVKIKCMGCNRIIMLERHKFVKDIKKVIKKNLSESE